MLLEPTLLSGDAIHPFGESILWTGERYDKDIRRLIIV